MIEKNEKGAPIYFDQPTQVMWYDVDCGEYKAGIAYCDEIICACCGGVTSIEEIYEFAPDEVADKYNVIVPLSWVDMTEAIEDEKAIEEMIKMQTLEFEKVPEICYNIYRK